ncbi:MAG TPA: hypothetical protein VNE40_04070 [Candidatus Dormibacteraeota bacterium]|nr:hypothetical protein [Candidatus Dormibacteraeota bacterium]
MRLGFRKRKQLLARHQRPRMSGRGPAVFSYHARRAEYQFNTGRGESRSQRRPELSKFVGYWLQRIGFLIGTLILIVGLVNVLVISSPPRIDLENSPSSQFFMRNILVYQKSASDAMARSFWNNNKITLNTAGIAQELKSKFPEIADATISLPIFGHKPIIYIEPNQLAFILSASNGNFVIGQNGAALFARQSLPTKNKLNLLTLTDQSNLRIQVGQSAFPSSQVNFIQEVIAELRSRGVQISNLTLPAAASELDAHLQGLPYIVKFNLQNNDPRQQAGTFLAVKAHLDSAHISPTQYIDVRVDGRAYYK